MMVKKITDEILKQLQEQAKELAPQIEKWKKESEGKPYDFEMVITTEDRDRHDEVILQDGLNVDNYMKAPVVLYGHHRTAWDLREGTPIVGYTAEIVKDKATKQTIAKGYFVPRGFSLIADQVRTLYEVGMPMPASVGIKVFEYDAETRTIISSELAEWSFVEIAANPQATDALQRAIAAGLDVKACINTGILSKDFENFITVKNDPAPEQEQKEEPEDPESESTPEQTESENESNAEQTDEEEKSEKQEKTLAEQVAARLTQMQSRVLDEITSANKDVIDLVSEADNNGADKALQDLVLSRVEQVLQPLEELSKLAALKVDERDSELEKYEEHKALHQLLKAVNNTTSAALQRFNEKRKKL